MKKTYNIKVTEKYTYYFSVQTESGKDAIEAAKKCYDDEAFTFVADGTTFDDVDFKVEK